MKNTNPSIEPALSPKQIMSYAEDLAHTYQSLQTSEKGYQSLWYISTSLHQYANVNDLMSQIVHKVSEVMDAGDVSLMLCDNNTEVWICCRSSNESEQIINTREPILPSGHPMAAQVYKSGIPEIFPEIQQDSSNSPTFEGHLSQDERSIIVVPLKTKERTSGVLEVTNKSNRVFNNKDLFFLSTLAPILAMALDNATLYTQLHNEYQELQISDQMKENLIKYTQEENIHLRKAIEHRYHFNHIIGYSDRMLDVFRLCEKVMDSDITVLVEGETGTGKELIARCIHQNGPRKNKLFVSQNCSGIPDTLLTSELFGHRKGAFTDAVADKKGLFEIANGGTVFLDEVAEMSAAMQSSLLRVLQAGEIKPLGAEYAKKVDVRVISATNKNLEEDVNAGRFREDLFYRLNIFTINLPPLRDRAGDIQVLTKYFQDKFQKKSKKSITNISREALQYLEAYAFPGNVRELENEMERAVTMAENGGPIDVAHLSDKIRKKSAMIYDGIENQETLKQMVETLEKSMISEALKGHGNNKSIVARELGLSRNGLMKKMQRYGL